MPAGKCFCCWGNSKSFHYFFFQQLTFAVFPTQWRKWWLFYINIYLRLKKKNNFEVNPLLLQKNQSVKTVASCSSACYGKPAVEFSEMNLNLLLQLWLIPYNSGAVHSFSVFHIFFCVGYNYEFHCNNPCTWIFYISESNLGDIVFTKPISSV